MEKQLVFLSFLLCFLSVNGNTDVQTYIVHVLPPENNTLSAGNNGLEEYYKSFMPKTAMKEGQSSSFIYSYEEVISGFAARLTAEQLKEMEKKEGFLYAYPDRVIPLLTTYTPDFLGLQLGSGLWKQGSNLGEGVIIGVLDSGFTPEHPSFKDDGMPAPPSKWKGGCETESLCNNKVIGVKTFVSSPSSFVSSPSSVAASGSLPSEDVVGHGTHTASTAGGTTVSNANVFSNDNGTASGIAPRAHLAIYKVCAAEGCASIDILAGMDAAVKDGADVLSISLGGNSVPFYQDSIAIGAFAAVDKGMFVSCAAGNSGPGFQTLSNDAPWILTVAASTTDREVRAVVKIGDNQNTFNGQSLFQPKNYTSPSSKIVVPNNYNGQCDDSAFDGVEVKGNIAFCVGSQGGRTAAGIRLKAEGAGGVIIMNQQPKGYTTFSDAQVLPASHVSYADGSAIMKYINSTKTPTASIVFNGTMFGVSPSPAVAYFSSRGPSTVNRLIVKPDITGPGVNILAGWNLPILNFPSMKQPYFNVISGTSMSTPHLSGVAALLKKAHPNWSPSAIKSAIITTSDILDRGGSPIANEQHKPATFFEMGSGHVNPSKAADPGLVYETETTDYIPFLCGLGYDDDQVAAIIRRKISCTDSGKVSQSQLNYPSIGVSFPKGSVEVSVNRTVTNVGPANSTYKVEVDDLGFASVEVQPTTLEFSEVNEKKTFVVTFRSKGMSEKAAQGNLRWSSENHIVRSPLFVEYSDLS